MLELIYGNDLEQTNRLFPDGLLTEDSLSLEEVQALLRINTGSSFLEQVSYISHEFTSSNYGAMAFTPRVTSAYFWQGSGFFHNQNQAELDSSTHAPSRSPSISSICSE